MKDTIISILISTNTQHDIRIAGTFSREMLDRLRDAIECGQDIQDAVQLLEDEDMRVLAYEREGRLLDRSIDWQMARHAARRPPEGQLLETVTPLILTD